METSSLPTPSLNGHRNGGPKTLAGKTQSRMNAITHGLSACDDIFASTLFGQNKIAFDKLRRSLARYYRPRTEYEKLVVDRLAICHFRILMVSRHESIALQMSDIRFHPHKSIVPHLDRFSRYDMRLERQINVLHNRLVQLQKSRGSNIPKPFPVNQ